MTLSTVAWAALNSSLLWIKFTLQSFDSSTAQSNALSPPPNIDIIFPLNIYEGQKAGFKYKKNVGKNMSDLKGIKINGEKSNIRTSEFLQINSIGVSIKI